MVSLVIGLKDILIRMDGMKIVLYARMKVDVGLLGVRMRKHVISILMQ